PGNEAASKGLVAAEAALASDQAERAKLDEFRKHLTAGEAALAAGRLRDAIAAFVAAQAVLPGNAQVAALRREAEIRLALEQNRKDNKADYDRLIEQGATALRNQRFLDAAVAYQKALALVPNDPVAAKGLADAQLAQRNLGGQFELLMTRGALAMREARFKDA